MTMPRVIFGCHDLGVVRGRELPLSSSEWAEARDTAKLPTTHRRAPQESIIWPQMSIVPRLRDPFFKRKEKEKALHGLLFAPPCRAPTVQHCSCTYLIRLLREFTHPKLSLFTSRQEHCPPSAIRIFLLLNLLE